ncbi:MAG: SprT family zinc-dependent metalloprotease [Patescibacteria group bacterium]
MSQKIIILPEIGEITLQKRRGTRSIRLTVGHDGTLRISMPPWSPYKVGEAFAISKSDWIRTHQLTKTRPVLLPDQRIGKAHRIRFIHEHRSTITCRVTATELVVRLPLDKQPTDSDVQKDVSKGSIRALKQEARNLLPGRIEDLAKRYGFEYQSVSIKQLKSRWGSCSSQKNIALSCFLMQLPWELIDYVIMHELLHTRVMAHGSKFWTELNQYVYDLPAKRKLMKTYQPILLSQA